MEVRRVDAARGWAWIVEAFELFKLNPMMWIVLIILYFIIAMALSLVGLIGSLALYLIAPILYAGFMEACRALDNGEELLINHLFAGFKKNTGQLVAVGGIYLSGIVVIMGTMFAVIASMGVDVSTLSRGVVPEAGISKHLLLAILFGLLFLIPLAMAYWFAPALVVLNNLSATEAMKQSFNACWHNMLPLFIYSLIGALLLLLAAIPFGLGLLAVVPIMIIVFYTSYKDIFNIQSPAALTV